jgi:hypothetical protein
MKFCSHANANGENCTWQKYFVTSYITFSFTLAQNFF